MKVPSKGTLLKVESATPGTYTTIGQRLSVTPPALVNGTKDDTDLDDVIRKMSSTILESPEVALKIQYDMAMATHATLTTMAVAGSASSKNFKVVFNDNSTEANRSTWAFPGWVKSFTPGEAAIDGNNEADVVIVLTDVPTLTVRS